MCTKPFQAPPILVYGHPKLRGINKLVPANYPPNLLYDHIVQMYAVLSESGGSAIAANQIGLDLRIFLVSKKATIAFPPGITCCDSLYGVFINPYFTDLNGQMPVSDDSCLSLPGYAPNPNQLRYASLKLHYQQLTCDSLPCGNPSNLQNGPVLTEFNEVTCDGIFNGGQFKFFTSVVQHEVDHLDGKFFIDQFPPSQQDTALLNKLRIGDYSAGNNPTLPANKY